MIYKLEALKDKTVLRIYKHIGIVNDVEGFMLSDFKKETSDLNGGILEIEINSPGGNTIEAFAIHDSIKLLNVKTIGKVLGVAASAATIILAACDIREISQNSSYLVHNSRTSLSGTKETLAEGATTLEQVDEKMLNIYMKQTG